MRSHIVKMMILQGYKAYEYLIKNIQADQFEILIQRTSDLVKRINNLSKNYYANESIEKHIDWNIVIKHKS